MKRGSICCCTDRGMILEALAKYGGAGGYTVDGPEFDWVVLLKCSWLVGRGGIAGGC